MLKNDYRSDVTIITKDAGSIIRILAPNVLVRPVTGSKYCCCENCMLNAELPEKIEQIKTHAAENSGNCYAVIEEDHHLGQGAVVYLLRKEQYDELARTA